MSRVDVKEHVPNPGTAERYAIIRSCLLELQRCGKIELGQDSELHGQAHSGDDLQPDNREQLEDTPPLVRSNPHDEEDDAGLERATHEEADNTRRQDDMADEVDMSINLGECICGHVYIPTYGETLFSSHKSDELTRRLQELCKKSNGMSGRELRRLPALAVSMYLHGQQHSLYEVLSAMDQVMQETERK